ncbi:MAG: exodeoxyribonuclease VII small subunit [Bacteroidales bacterium]
MEKMTYTQATKELEQLVQAIQENKLEIDELKVAVTRAGELLAICKKILHETDVELQAIIDKIE